MDVVRYEGGTDEFGRPHGQGIAYYQDGARFEGEFKDGKLHGQCKITFADGGTHEGCYKDGSLHGQGKKTFADGGTHEGCFKDGELHRGKHTYAVCLGRRPTFVRPWRDRQE